MGSIVVFLAMDSKQIFHNGKSRDSILTEISRYSFMLFEAVKINLEDTTGGKKIRKQVWKGKCIMRVSASQRETQSCRPPVGQS